MLSATKNYWRAKFIRKNVLASNKLYHMLHWPKNISKHDQIQHFQMQKKLFSDCMKPPEKKDVCTPETAKWPSGNRITYKFDPEVETALNSHINIEFKAFYYYLSMANYFNRVDVALRGCRNYFIKMHNEEYHHALQFINYINSRGGSVTLCPIEVPPDQDWKCPLNAFKTALKLELEIAEKLNNLHDITKKHCDLSASDFIVTNFIKEQIDSINEIGKLNSILSGIGDHALSRFVFDQHLLNTCISSNVTENPKHGKCT